MADDVRTAFLRSLAGPNTFPEDVINLWRNMRPVRTETYHNDTTDQTMRLPPTPGQFRPDPVSNDPEVQALLHAATRQVPGLTGLQDVTLGPNDDIMSLFSNPGAGQRPFGAEEYPTLNINGATRGARISLNPRLQVTGTEWRNSLIGTLAHELTHAAGFGSETVPEAVATRMRQLLSGGASKPLPSNWRDIK